MPSPRPFLGAALPSPAVLLASALCLLVGLGGATPAAAGEPDGSAEQTLAERYAPFVAVRDQEEACDTDGEGYAPTSVDIVLDNPEVVLRDGAGAVVVEAPTAADLFDAGDDHHLDYPGDALDPGCVYERDFRRFAEDRPPVVYAHVARQADRPGLMALQYWTFWYFNDWNNNHETDWEGIQLVFEADTAAEALDAEPIEVGFAQHEGGERRTWDDEVLRRDGDRVVVHASAGSHAGYYGEDLYLGRSGSEGFGCDDTGAPVERLDPEVVVLPDAVDDRSSPLAWLAFDGRWGEQHPGPFNGPTGPTAKDRWAEPITWQEGLRESSVIVPADEVFGPRATDAFCAVTAAGSVALAGLLGSPVVTLLLLAALVALVAAAVRVARPSIGAARSIQRADRSRYVRVGILFVVTAAVSAPLQWLVLRLPVIGPFVELGGRDGPSSLALALMLGATGSLVTAVVVQAVVTSLVDADRSGRELGVADALRHVLSRWRAWASASAWSLVTVTVLAATVIGLPFAAFLAVRWSLIGPLVGATPVGGRGALRASTVAVRGRWWSTAAVLTATVIAALVAGPVVGIALMLVTGLPLALLNVVSSVVYVLTVPVAALALDHWWRSGAPVEAQVDEATSV